MLTVTWAELRAHRSRVAALLAAIVISVGFVVGVLTFVSTASHSLRETIAAPLAGADAVVEVSVDRRATAEAKRLSAVPGVAEAAPQYQAYGEVVGPEGAALLKIESRPDDPALQTGTLASGRWPAAADEVAVTTATAKRQALALGSTVRGDGFGDAQPPTLRVVGLVDGSATLFDGLNDEAVAATSFFTADPTRDQAYRYLVRGDGAVAPAVLADRLTTATKADGGEVATRDAYIAAQTKSITHDTDVFGIVLLVFGAIALLVAAVIIANTLSVVVAQRRRQLGLLRAAGADARQVSRGVLVESAVLGLAGSLGGVVIGLVAAAIAVGLTGFGRYGLAVPAGRVGLAVLVGVVVTVLAGIVPARQAARVSPMEALRPPATDDPRRRVRTARVVVVAACAVVGGGLIALAVLGTASQVPMAVAGAGVLTIGVVVATPLFLPLLLRGLGRGAGVAGATGRLAARNALRNPGRAAATCVALMLAVGLVVLLQVGAASTKATVTARIDRSNPVDVTLTSYETPISDGVRRAVAAVPGVTATAAVRTGAADRADDKDSSVFLVGVGPDARAVVAADWDDLSDSTLLVSADNPDGSGATPGEDVTLVSGSRRVTLHVVASHLADGAGGAVVTAAVLDRLQPDAPANGLWVRVPDKDHAGDVLADLRRAAAQQPNLDLSGGLVESAQYDEILDTLLTAATALLAVAVVIAIIGVGNTLGLSVLERTRESALLRALGLQRRQLRGMLVVEAVLLAVAGAVVGVIAGIGFGWLGVVALSHQADLGTPVLVVPATTTVIAVLVAVAAGALASLPPARRAARATPVAALADA